MREVRDLWKHIRGVSPVIATLLLIAIATAASVATYTWVMSMISTQSRQSETSIKIDMVDFQKKSEVYNINVTIRNTGSVYANVETIYVYKGESLVTKAQYFASSGDTYTTYYSIPAGTAKVLVLTTDTATPIVGANAYHANLSFTLFSASGYTIKVVTDNGFYVEGIYYAPISL